MPLRRHSLLVDALELAAALVVTAAAMWVVAHAFVQVFTQIGATR